MIHPLFKCFGSKWQASRLLPKPEYESIVEPFAGGAGYSLRHNEKQIFLYERDPQVLGLWHWLTEDATEFVIRDIPVGLPEGTDIRLLDLCPGQELLLKFWQRTNNVGNCWTISPWGHLPGQWTSNTRARVAEEVQGVKHWIIGGDDWTQAFIGGPKTYFVDPPYQGNYQYRQPPIDYEALAQACLSASGQVLVCEAVGRDGTVPTWLPFEPWASRVTSRRVSGRRSAEMLCVIDGTPDTIRNG